MSDLQTRLIHLVADDLKDIEEILKNNLNPYLDLVNETASHILFSGGKRLRPLLVVLAARVCGKESEYPKKFSAIFEYLHAATLLHDDIVDGATLRRGKPAAHSIWGGATAVLVGDFLLARALTIAAEAERPDVIKVIAWITEHMSQGEIHQLMYIGNIELTEEEYLQVIRHKTATLIEGACKTGALLADAAQAEVEALAQYGYHLGIAFQMADDLLDYTSETGVLGKTVGADLKEGKITLPVIHALRNATLEERGQMSAIIQKKEFLDSDFDHLLNLLKKYDSIGYTERAASAHQQQAVDCLAPLPDSQAKTALSLIAEYAVARKH